MLTVTFAMLQHIVMFFLIVAVVQLLKRRGVFDDSHQPVFDHLVTEFALPAIVFGMLTTNVIRTDWILPILIVNIAVIITMVMARAACRAFTLPPAATGTVVILSAWGSTYTVGAPVLATVFGTASEELALGNALGTFGFALPFFTLGIIVAGYFGLAERGERFFLPAFLKDFFCSPVFLAFWLGIVVSLLLTVFNLPGEAVFDDVFVEFFVVIQHALNLLVWIALGLLLRPVHVRTFLPLLALVAIVNLFVLPGLVFAMGSVAGLPLMERQVAVILAAMPSGAIAAVIADRYGCDGKLAAAIVIGTYLVSLVTLPAIVFLGM